eukprot:COSAG05_NODE_3325_length_2149_cov_1.597073_1_plen_693_part_10
MVRGGLMMLLLGLQWRAMLLLSLGPVNISANPLTTFEATIDAVHARAARATTARLRYAYNTSIVPIGDNCTSWNTEHGGIQGSTYALALAALYINGNDTRVGEAQLFFEKLARCLAGPSSSAGTAQPLEMSYVTRAYAMFNSRSSWVASGQVAALGTAAETSMQAFFYKFLTQFGPLEKRWGATMEGAIWSQFGSENRDTNEQIACYIAAQYLALDPGYASRMPYAPPGAHNSSLKRCQHCCKAGCGDICCHPSKCCCVNVTTCPSAPSPPPGPSTYKTIGEIAAQWDDFMYAWLEARATTGFWIEIGSNSYWYRTWPAVLNLLDLPLSTRVRQRAKMFVDLAIVEAEQTSIRGVRGGVKARSKKDGAGHHDGLNHSMIGRMGYSLFGLDTDEPGGAGRTPWVNLDTNSYLTSNVSILMRELGKAPSTNGTYTMRNRLIGQVAKPAMGDDDSGAGSSSGVALSTRAQYVTQYLNRSDQINTISATRAYSLGGVEFSPADAFSPNTMNRWTGLIFNNRETTLLGLPHTHGDKWAVIDGDVMIAQNCGSCSYQGMPLVSILGGTKPVRWNQSGWVIVEAADAGGRGLAAWAAVKPAWGGWVPRSPANSNFTSADLPWVEQYAPIIFLVGEQGHESELGKFATEGAFIDAVLAAPLAASAAKVSLSWGGRDIKFFPGPNASSNASTAVAYQLPTVN